MNVITGWHSAARHARTYQELSNATAGKAFNWITIMPRVKV